MFIQNLIFWLSKTIFFYFGDDILYLLNSYIYIQCNITYAYRFQCSFNGVVYHIADCDMQQ